MVGIRFENVLKEILIFFKKSLIKYCRNLAFPKAKLMSGAQIFQVFCKVEFLQTSKNLHPNSLIPRQPLTIYSENQGDLQTHFNLLFLFFRYVAMITTLQNFRLKLTKTTEIEEIRYKCRFCFAQTRARFLTNPRIDQYSVYTWCVLVHFTNSCAT